jgi:hypothetical protein
MFLPIPVVCVLTDNHDKVCRKFVLNPKLPGVGCEDTANGERGYTLSFTF